MNQLVVILLIPFLLLGNVLAHSHGSGAHQSANHSRAHIHIGSALHHGYHSHDAEDHHHGHDHESEEQESAPLPPAEHNSDAIYLASVGDAYTPSDRVSTEFGASCFIDAPPCILNESRPPAVRSCKLTADPSELPLYLLHAALRL